MAMHPLTKASLAFAREHGQKRTFYCEHCKQVLNPRTLTWLEMHTDGTWAEPGKASWSDTDASQGCFPLGKACARHLLARQQLRIDRILFAEAHKAAQAAAVEIMRAVNAEATLAEIQSANERYRRAALERSQIASKIAKASRAAYRVAMLPAFARKGGR